MALSAVNGFSEIAFGQSDWPMRDSVGSRMITGWLMGCYIHTVLCLSLGPGSDSPTQKSPPHSGTDNK